MGSKKKKNIDIIDAFGDDFEVSYEEEAPLTYKLPPKPKKKNKKKEAHLDVVNVNSVYLYEDDDDYFYDNRYADEYDEYYDDNEYDDEEYYDEEYYDEEYYDDEYDDDYTPPRHRTSKKSARRKKTPLAAPIKKGGKKVFAISHALLRNLSLILILVIIAFMAINFLRGSAPYGDIYEELMAQDFSLKLVAFFATAACFILYELLAALWTMSKARVRDEYGRHKEDVGRGLGSFIYIYIGSYVSFLICSHIPEINDLAIGIKGALTVFGSMHNVLFGLCAAGVVSCLLRKYHL